MFFYSSYSVSERLVETRLDFFSLHAWRLDNCCLVKRDPVPFQTRSVGDWNLIAAEAIGQTNQ